MYGWYGHISLPQLLFTFLFFLFFVHNDDDGDIDAKADGFTADDQEDMTG